MTDDDSRLLPFLPSVRASDPDRLVVGLTDEDGTALFEALSSETARNILAQLHEEPSTPPELATALGCSRQVVHYHLSNLEATGLITAIDTGYSKKGVEMTIYAPTADPLVVKHAPDENDAGRWLSTAKLVGATGLLAIVGVIVAARRWLITPISTDPAVESGHSAPSKPPVTENAAGDWTATTTPIPTNETVSNTTERVLDGTHSAVPTPSPHTASLLPELPTELMVLFGLLFVLSVFVRHHRSR